MRRSTHRPRRTPSRRERSGVFFRIQNKRASDVFRLEGLENWPEFEKGVDAVGHVALALYPRPYLPVSVALVASALGATKLRGCTKGLPITPAAARAKEAQIRGGVQGRSASDGSSMRSGASTASVGKQRSTRKERVQAATSIQRFTAWNLSCT